MKNWEKIRQNQKLKEIQIQRSKINNLIRDFFAERGFIEMQTPALVKCAGQEPYLSPVKAIIEDDRNKKYKGFLITSPEYSLKKLLAAGFDKIFEMAKVFRSNESFGGIHNPEFTMLEWYRTNSNYNQIMKDTEELIYFLAKKMKGSGIISYQRQKINLALPWPRITVKSLFQKYAGINLDKAKTLKNFKKQIKNKNYLKFDDWNDIFYLIFLNEIEPNFPKDRPIIVYDYPLPQASLARKKSEKSFYAERFEVYIGGMELANAFSELTDAKEQDKRFKEERSLRKKMRGNDIDIDKDLIHALELHIPPSGGIALGVERLQMILLDAKDINEILPFPARDLFSDNKK